MDVTRTDRARALRPSTRDSVRGRIRPAHVERTGRLARTGDEDPVLAVPVALDRPSRQAREAVEGAAAHAGSVGLLAPLGTPTQLPGQTASATGWSGTADASDGVHLVPIFPTASTVPTELTGCDA